MEMKKNSTLNKLQYRCWHDTPPQPEYTRLTRKFHGYTPG